MAEPTDREQIEAQFRVDGMDCAACAAKIETAARRAEGVSEVSVSVTAGTLRLVCAPQTDLDALARRVESLGYEIAPLEGAGADAHAAGGARHDHVHDHDHDHDHGHGHGHDHGAEEKGDAPFWRTAKARLTLACGGAVALAWIVGHIVPAAEQYAFVAAMLVGLAPVARRALAAARNGSPFTIETLMTVAAIGAVFIGAAEEAAFVVFLFLVGEMLEGLAAGRARAGIQALAALAPKSAQVEKNGALVAVPVEALAVGDVVLARPGEKIAADGEVLAGQSQVNEAPITGESVPVAKGPGDRAFAGTINGEAALRIRVSARARDNTIARVVRLVEEAQEARAPTERLIDRFSRYYTPGVMLVGALVALAPPLLAGAPWGEWIYKGLAVLLIGCPCALVISVPAAIAASLSAGARRGLLIKGGDVLERLGATTLACFDKTGTLTRGEPAVTDVLAFRGTQAELLALAAGVEAGSDHPLARAILAAAAKAGVAPAAASNMKAIGGKGASAAIDGREVFLGSPAAAAQYAATAPEQSAAIEALQGEGKSVCVLVADGAALGALAMRDEPREDAREALAALARLGVKTVMLTGDNQRAARAVGAALGIEARAELSPQDKQRIVREFQALGEKVAKIGDGINDAPALAAADVGIAMGGGADVALETADAASLRGRMGDMPALIALSRATMRNIRQNIAIALGLKALFLVTTLAGLTGLWPAILADTGATVLVTANALRLLNARPQA